MRPAHGEPRSTSRGPVARRQLRSCVADFEGRRLRAESLEDMISSFGGPMPFSSALLASLLLADARNTFDCRYVGVVVLPKQFGSYPIYHIKRKTEVG